MKADNILKTLLAAGVALVSLNSCQEKLHPFAKGDEVKFTVGSSQGVGTKAAYQAFTGSEAVGGKVRIDWQEGDLVRVYCAQVSEPDEKYADYVVTQVLGKSGAVSKAKIGHTSLGQMGLRWGEEEEHHFYATYPSPDAGGITKTLTGKDVEATLPAEQDTLEGALSESGGNYTLAPDLKWQLMTAYASYSPATGISEGDGVFLSFSPLSTAINFTISNGSENALVIDRIELISEASQISGGFSVDIDSGSVTAHSGASVTEAEKSIWVTMPEGGLSLAKDKTFNFTLFLAPSKDIINDLTFKIYRHDGTWMSTKLAYNDADRTGVAFPKSKITFVNGIIVPDGAQWTVKYAADVQAWDHTDNGAVDFLPELTPLPFVTSWNFGYEYSATMTKYYYTFNAAMDDVYTHAGGTGTLSITSTKESTHNVDEAVLWHLEYYDPDAEGENKWIVPDETPYYIKDFVSFSQVSGINLGVQDITMDVKAASSEKGEVTTGVTHTARLRDASQTRGSESAPYDLSMYDIHGNARAAGRPVTANSYVIAHPGVYAFPLAYGNGIDFTMAPAGGDNANAYDPGSEMQPTSVYLTRFPNANGDGIRSPYIETDLKVGDISGWTAYPVWQDAPSNALVGTCTVLTREQAAGKGLTACSGGYVMFTVSPAALVQGNAVIAVTDGPRTLWSWHLWFTDNDLNPVDVRTNDTYQTMHMLPVNLGWVDGSDAGATYYKGNSLKVRLVQDGSEAVREFTITRREESSVTHTLGSSTYYQWGRKDPFIRAFNHSGTWGEYQAADVTLHDAGVPAISKVAYNATTDLAYSIKNPTHFVYNSAGQWYHAVDALGNAAGFYNLWSALNGSAGSGVLKEKHIKTIYDPCPPGYQVPQGNAFMHFSTSEVSGEFQNGYYFKTGFTTAGAVNTVYFPASGFRGYGSGNLDYLPSASTVGGCYWTAVPISAAMGYYLIFTATATPDANRVRPTGSHQWSTGFSIRPVKE